MERAGLWRARVNRFRGGTGMKISWIWAVSLGLAPSVFGAAASAAPAIPWTPPVGHGAVQLVDTAVEEMPPRVLRQQLGKAMAAKLGLLENARHRR